MSPSPAPVVFFDLAGTLGIEARSPGGPPLELFEVYPDIRPLLERLGERARLGILANGDGVTPDVILDALGRGPGTLAAIFDVPLVIGTVADSVTHFTIAIEAAGHSGDPSRCIFVSTSRARRGLALQAGMRVAPHPLLVEALLDDDLLVYARAVADTEPDWSDLIAGRPIVPAYLAHERRPTLYAVASLSAANALHGTLPGVEVLFGGRGIEATDLYLIRVSEATPDEEVAFTSRIQAALGRVARSDEGLIVALPPDRSIDEFHPPNGAHGHTAILLPRPTVLMKKKAPPTPTAASSLTAQETATLAGLTAASFQQQHGPLCGLAALPSGSVVQSRHIAHPENPIVVTAVLDALNQICGNALRVAFNTNVQSQSLDNIQADIPGTRVPLELVIVGAHIDSTAALDSGYQGASGAAPGADDDATGVAAVLEAARVLKALSAFAPAQRTIRFVLFNAEEEGLAGSSQYASDLMTTEQNGGPKVIAMLQMDMIGWTKSKKARKPFEVHAADSGYSATLRTESSHLAAIVKSAVELVSSSGLSMRRFPVSGSTLDPFTNRSDQAWFLAEGWPACLVSEDDFAGAAGGPMQNPDYHHVADDGTGTKIQYQYAADIARAVAAAAWMIAKV